MSGSMRTHSGHHLTQLAELLGHAIVTGEYNSANAPTELEISRRFGTSRTVTREALKMLSAKGLINARPRLGTVAAPESEWNLLDPDVLRWLLERKFSLTLLTQVTEVRLGIEPVAAALAARNADELALGNIIECLRRMKTAENDENDALSADIAFHIAILKATKNPFYCNFYELVNIALRVSIRFTNRIKGRTASIPSHEDVVQAIVDRDEYKAATAMRIIIFDALKMIEIASRLTANNVAHKCY